MDGKHVAVHKGLGQRQCWPDWGAVVLSLVPPSDTTSGKHNRPPETSACLLERGLAIVSHLRKRQAQLRGYFLKDWWKYYLCSQINIQVVLSLRNHCLTLQESFVALLDSWVAIWLFVVLLIWFIKILMWHYWLFILVLWFLSSL